MEAAEGQDRNGSGHLDGSQSSFADAPVIDRIPKFASGGAKKRLTPRPTLAKPRTTLLLPRSGAGWIKMLGSVAAAGALMASALFGVRTLIGDTSCETFTLNRQTLSAPGGLSVHVRPDALAGNAGLKFSTTSLADFTKPGADLAQQAGAALPKALTPRSSFVGIASCNTEPRGMTLRMAAPADEAELNKLDMYGWNAETNAWSWLGGEVDPATREIVARASSMPSGIVLVKTNPTQPVLSIEMSPKQSNSGGPVSPIPSAIGEVSVSGLYLGDFGALAGDRSRLQAPVGAKVVPVIRNWSDKGEVNRRLLRDMLAKRSNSNQHVINIMTLVEAGNYSGVEIDYRGLDLKQRDQFTAFITALSTSLQAKGKTLTVAIPAPIMVSEKWDVGGYDMNALGLVANFVKLDLSANPGALTSQQLDSLLHWSAGQVNRYKLQLVVPALSIRQDAYGRTGLINLDAALAPLGGLEPEQSAVQPGARVRLKWKGKVSNFKFDDASQTYRYSYLDPRGIQQNVWVYTPASLKRALERLGVHNVRGITLRGLDSASNSEDMVQIVNSFAERRIAEAQAAMPDLTVNIAGASMPLSNRLDAPIEVQAPAKPGEYPIQSTFNGGRAVQVVAQAIKVDKDAQPTAPTATPQTPANPDLQFELGGHAGSLEHVAQMKSSGMGWIRTTVVKFDMPAEFIRDAKANGLKVAIEAIGDKARVMDEAYQSEWAAHLGRLAAAGADAIEVWDEPNYEGSWPAGKINGAAYTALLKKAHSAIKKANPKTLVISGGLVSSEVFGGGCAQNGCDDIMFLSQMAAAGAQNYMDCVGAHYTGGFSSPGASGGPGANASRSFYYAPMRDLYYQAFANAKPVCFTELGFVTADGFKSDMPKNYAWAGATTLGQHAQWLAESAKLSKESGKVRLLLVWNIDSGLWVSGDNGDPQAGYAMIRPDGTCPACETLRGVMTSQ
jgi:hypothetical protein